MARKLLVALLLMLPYAAVLWPPFYNHRDPVLAGVPFFYWYQLAWVFLTAGLIGLALWLSRGRR